jgi:hypothetical protein
MLLMFFYVNDIVFAFKVVRERNAENEIRRMKNMFDSRDLRKLNFFLHVRVIRKLNTISFKQDFYMNKFIKTFVLNTRLKTTTSLFYQKLILYIDEMNDKKAHIYNQKMRFIYNFAIIIKSNVAKIVFELILYFINLSSNYFKTMNHCIKYLHVFKILIIRYSISKNEKLSNQISNSNKKMLSSHSKFNKNTSSSNKNFNYNKEIFERTMNDFFANDLDCKNVKNYKFKLYDDMIDWIAGKKFTISTFIIKARLL